MKYAKLKLHPYSENFPKFFAKEKAKIVATLKGLKGFRIYHVGSTAVSGMLGKGIIDIAIAIKDWKIRSKYVAKLKEIGFRFQALEEKYRLFLRRVDKTGLGDVHIHLVKLHSKEMQSLVGFRNLLRRNKSVAKRYGELKLAWLKLVKGDRIKFGKLKEKYIRKEIAQKL
ncbi:MAG: GrpB family protein [Candidatus Doudnabacteria bacterium]|nr:GrpB family protein [Candidatus Doudnabacteria bacterium]